MAECVEELGRGVRSGQEQTEARFDWPRGAVFCVPEGKGLALAASWDAASAESRGLRVRERASPALPRTRDFESVTACARVSSGGEASVCGVRQRPGGLKCRCVRRTGTVEHTRLAATCILIFPKTDQLAN